MIQILFQNENFVVCDKESGVLSTPSRFEDSDARGCLGTELQKELGLQIYPVHRLDFEVSGLVMYAKNSNAHRIANSWFEQKTVQKTYRAVTTSQDYSHIPANVPNPKLSLEVTTVGQKFSWKSRILRGKRRAYESPQGKDTLTLAEYLGHRQNGFILWDLQPVTGRSHQLRFDLSRHGFPILGDKLYGSKVPWADQAIALRSYKIDFSGAREANKLGLPKEITASLPSSMLAD